jgi:hypothetical protein
MTIRKITPVKPRSEFNCTLYLADLGIAIKMQGHTSYQSHGWRDHILMLTFTPSYPQQAVYHGSQNVVVFHEAGRTHHLTNLRIHKLHNGSMYLECNGVNLVQFEEPACEWFSFDLARFDEVLQLPRPTMDGFWWRYSESHHESSLCVEYRYTTRQPSVNSLGTKYMKPNKLDIMLEELVQ